MPDLPTVAHVARRHLERSLLEVYQNTYLHGHSSIGLYCCGQYFPRRKTISFTLVDAGIGFAGSLRRAGIVVKSHEEALREVVERGATARLTRTGGLGIGQLRLFVDGNRGKVDIVSYNGCWSHSAGRDEFATIRAEFPGTLVNLDFRVDAGVAPRIL